MLLEIKLSNPFNGKTIIMNQTRGIRMLMCFKKNTQVIVLLQATLKAFSADRKNDIMLEKSICLISKVPFLNFFYTYAWDKHSLIRTKQHVVWLSSFNCDFVVSYKTWDKLLFKMTWMQRYSDIKQCCAWCCINFYF